MIVHKRNRTAILAMLAAGAATVSTTMTTTTTAFVPVTIPNGITTTTTGASTLYRTASPLTSSSFVTTAMVNHRRRVSSRSTMLKMSSDDFNQEKYTEAGWAAVAALTKVADAYQTSTVESPILLEILLNPEKHKCGDDADAGRRAVEKVLKEAKVDMKALRSQLETHLENQPKVTGNVSQQKTMGYSLPKVLDAARSAMSTLGDSFVSAEALLLGLVKEDNQFTTAALLKQNVKYTDILDVVVKMREKNGRIISRSAENNYDALLKYGIDFTERAEQGKLDPVIGRDDEIRRAIQVLSRRTKNNPVLIGDPGVGKSK
jgi:ATP-dependent Clp protease ATP-binding subunit ClpA